MKLSLTARDLQNALATTPLSSDNANKLLAQVAKEHGFASVDQIPADKLLSVSDTLVVGKQRLMLEKCVGKVATAHAKSATGGSSVLQVRLLERTQSDLRAGFRAHDGHVGSGEVGSGEVGSGDVGSGEVGSGDVGSGEVGSGDIGSGEVGSGDIGSGEVGSGEVGSGEVGSGEVGSGEVGSGELRDARI